MITKRGLEPRSLGAARMNKYMTILVGTVGLMGCMTPMPYEFTTPFSETDFGPWVGGGPANLKGQAFLRTVGGDVKTCAGAMVILFPCEIHRGEARRPQ